MSHVAGLMTRFFNGYFLNGIGSAQRCGMNHLHACRSIRARSAVEHQGDAKNHSQEDGTDRHATTLTLKSNNKI